MKIWSLTDEEIMSLNEERIAREKEYNLYLNTPVQTLWMFELDELEKSYSEWESTLTTDSNKKDALKKKRAPRKK